MAKKEKNGNQSEANRTESQQRMEKYVKSRESEKKGKMAVISLIGGSILILVILLIIILKLNGVGKTVVFSTDENGKVEATVEDASDVSAQNVADYIIDGIEGEGATETEADAENTTLN